MVFRSFQTWEGFVTNCPIFNMKALVFIIDSVFIGLDFREFNKSDEKVDFV